ncbi:MAG: hypothetical protein AB1442_10375 [Nitrospirota bacterium]
MPTGIMIKLASLILLTLAWTGCATDDLLSRFHRVDKKAGGFTKHYSESLFLITAKGHFSVELLLPRGSSKGENRFYLIVHDWDDKDVPGADVSALVRSAGGIGAEAKVIVTDEGGGLYRGKASVPDNVGKWELFIKITKDGITDSAIFLISGGQQGKTK